MEDMKTGCFLNSLTTSISHIPYLSILCCHSSNNLSTKRLQCLYLQVRQYHNKDSHIITRESLDQLTTQLLQQQQLVAFGRGWYK